jgi:SAM-dependent methyltransferase
MTAAPPPYPRSNHKAVLADVLSPAGLTIADVGCGDGAMVRLLTREGARVIGIEVSESQLARARAAERVGDEEYRIGSGEALPFADGTLDALLYFNSFHHLPEAAMAPALTEAIRVLKPAGRLPVGRLIVIEPLAEGAYFEMLRPLEDETAVRAAAYRLLQSPPPGLRPEREMTYLSTVRHKDCDGFLARVVAADPARRERLPALEAELRGRFAEAARVVATGFEFDQPMRLNLLVRAR